MREEFLHFIWQYQLFNHRNLKTSEGERIEIIKPGLLNHHSGPDFSDAHVRIGDNLWYGNIEIHVKGGDWYHHNHHLDPAYTNVILHVVYEDQIKEERKLPNIPVLNLKGRVDLHKYLKWQELINRPAWIPCQKQYHGVPELIKLQNIENLAVERLIRKTGRVLQILEHTKGDWEKALLVMLCRSLGAGVNADPFRLLGELIPLKLVRKLQGNRDQLESLIFGLAGFPPEPPVDEYMHMLSENFAFLKHKHAFTPMNPAQWKFMRMRPANFPVLRIAQLMAVLSAWSQLTGILFYKLSREELAAILRQPVNDYWKTHYRFGKECKPKTARMGKNMVDNIVINTVVPFVYTYGKKHNDSEKTESAIELLQFTAAEKNHIISGWKSLGSEPRNAFETQGLIELKNEYCSFKKCLSCKAGIWILNQS